MTPQLPVSETLLLDKLRAAKDSIWLTGPEVVRVLVLMNKSKRPGNGRPRKHGPFATKQEENKFYNDRRKKQ